MHRAFSVLLFTFGPLRGSTGLLSWVRPALSVLAALGAIIGITFPGQAGGAWLALGSVIALCVLLFLAAYRLHALTFPNFPRHKLDVGTPWVADNPSPAMSGDEKLLLLRVTFHNREREHRVNLTVDVLWSRVVGGQALGPYALSRPLASLGELEVLRRRMDVAPQKHVEGY